VLVASAKFTSKTDVPENNLDFNSSTCTYIKIKEIIIFLFMTTKSKSFSFLYNLDYLQ
jgi:hypothetical protein